MAALHWQGEGQQFRGGRIGGPEIVLDGSGERGPSPVVALALGLAACMAADVLEIAQKMRLPIGSLEVRLEGDRAAEPPRRYTSLRLSYVTGGVAPADEAKVWRAIELSRDRYCSVLHSLRPDIALDIELDLG